MVRLLPVLLLALPALAGPKVAGTYDTRVKLVSSTCPLQVQDNPTEVAQYGDTVITLRHAGTTYVGSLAADASFHTEPKQVTAGGVDYRITVTGRFTGDTLDATVELRYGSPECRVEVGWRGPRRSEK